ncbi:MAG: hypothetical protein OXB86_05365 [Bdellovibrionales bacterium]|nr:hypothetical protein [Bdellovibrionales bacterium]
MKYPDYPWREHFPVLEADHKLWEAEKDGSSLLLWALEKKIIDRDKYFDWAIEHYQLPLLDSHFFEYVVMGKDQWKKVKDLKEWGREVLPVWEWENIAYVGCMEPPKNQDAWDFPHRLVLVTDIALKMHWKSIKDFSDLLPKAAPAATQAQSLLPTEEPHQPSYDPLGEPVRETSDPRETSDTPQRDNILSLNQFKTNSTQQQSSASPSDPNTPTSPEKSSGIIQVKKKDFFSDLEEQTKSYFSGILLLKNENNLLFPVKWAGRVQIPNEAAPLISLTDNSIFSVLQKGFDYHGFIVENESNKKFFNDISWSVLPKHITAIPIPGPKKKAERIFLGVATKNLPYETLDNIKKIVLPFFEEVSQKQAA